MRSRAGGIAPALVALALFAGPAQADPIDQWAIAPGHDCTGPEVEAEPGTQEFEDRDLRNQLCALQRFWDRGAQPLGNTVPTYGQDPYRRPERHDGTRFRFSSPSIEGVPSVEVYRPCAAGTCEGLPEGLETHEPPYPVAIVIHGFTASKELHRMNTQAFAEAGYLAIGVNGTWPNPISAPNSSSYAVANRVVDWVYAGQGEAADADLDRVGMAGHSQGGSVTSEFLGDDRIHAVIFWDSGGAAALTPETITDQPAMLQMAEQGFATPQSYDQLEEPRGGVEEAAAVEAMRDAGLDVFSFTGRATTHVDWNGSGGPGGNRLFEVTSNYYNLAWFDRHLKGKLVLDGSETPAEETAERAHRQTIAQDAYDRLRATHFDDSADVHNISMGLYDPVQALENGDPVFGGNVPYRIEGLPVADRLSFYYRHTCHISVPDYAGGSDGGPGDPVAARADTTLAGDIRTGGCPEVTP